MKQHNLTPEQLEQFLNGELKVDIKDWPIGMVLNLPHHRRQAKRFKPAFDQAIKTGKDVEIKKDDSNITSFKQRVGEALRLLSNLSTEYRLLRESIQLKIHPNLDSIVLNFKAWAIAADFKQAIGTLVEKKKIVQVNVGVLDEVKTFLASTDSVKQWKSVPSEDIEAILRLLEGETAIEKHVDGNTITIAKT